MTYKIYWSGQSTFYGGIEFKIPSYKVAISTEKASEILSAAGVLEKEKVDTAIVKVGKYIQPKVAKHGWGISIVSESFIMGSLVVTISRAGEKLDNDGDVITSILDEL